MNMNIKTPFETGGPRPLLMLIFTSAAIMAIINIANVNAISIPPADQAPPGEKIIPPINEPKARVPLPLPLPLSSVVINSSSTQPDARAGAHARAGFVAPIAAAGADSHYPSGTPIPSPTPEQQDILNDAITAKAYALVQRALRETPLIDGHNDLPWNLRKFLHGQLQEFEFDANLQRVQPWSSSAWSHTDLPRLRRGMVGAQFWVAYAPCEAQHLNAVQITLEQIDLILRLIAKYPNDLQLALTAEDIEKAHKAGKIASLIAVEGGHSIGNSLATLRAFYDLGVRYMTLTHNCNTPWADSSLVETKGHKPQHGGLTEFGRTVVREMNRLGMLVDLSHTSRLTMKDALKVSRSPVIFSHSSAHALCNSSRNVPDDILKELVWNRGIVMVTFYNYFVKCRASATVGDVAEHINYIRGRIGIDHIGIGGDFDGINRTPEGLEDVSKYPNLFLELTKYSNWSMEELKKVAGQNFLRVFREAENIRDSMRSSGDVPAQDLISMHYVQNEMKCRYNTSTLASPIH